MVTTWTDVYYNPLTNVYTIYCTDYDTESGKTNYYAAGNYKWEWWARVRAWCLRQY